MTTEEIRSVTTYDEHLSRLSEYLLCGWLSMTAELQKDLPPYWSFRDETVINDSITIKGKRIIIPASLQVKVLNQLPIQYMDIEKTMLLACESIF